jgi:hypothetical protein
MSYTAFTVGLAMLAACVVTFVAVLPRGGRVSPLLRNGAVETSFLVVWLATLLIGAALALFGTPTGILAPSDR